MRITIVFDDKNVIVDGVSIIVPTLTNNQNYHAFQWYDNWGEIEYKIVNGIKPSNKIVNNFNSFQEILDLYEDIKNG